MPVNETQGDDFSAFLAQHDSNFCDKNVCLFSNSSVHFDPNILQPNPTQLDEDPTMVAQQPTPEGSKFPLGLTLKYSTGSTSKLCQVVAHGASNLHHDIRILGSNENITVLTSDLDQIYVFDPADIPAQSADIDPASLQRCLTREDLAYIWSNAPDSVSPAQRLFLH